MNSSNPNDAEEFADTLFAEDLMDIDTLYDLDGSLISKEAEDALLEIPQYTSSQQALVNPPEEKLAEEEEMLAKCNIDSAKVDEPIAADDIIFGSASISQEVFTAPRGRDLELAYSMVARLNEVVECILISLNAVGPDGSGNLEDVHGRRALWLSRNCKLDRTQVAQVFRAIRLAEGRPALAEYMVCVFCNADRCHHSTACPHFPDLAARLANFACRDMCYTCARPKESCALEPCDPSRTCKRCKVKGHSSFLCTSAKSRTQDTANFARFEAALVVLNSRKDSVLPGPNWYRQIVLKKKKDVLVRKVSPNATGKNRRSRRRTRVAKGRELSQTEDQARPNIQGEQQARVQGEDQARSKYQGESQGRQSNQADQSMTASRSKTCSEKSASP